MLWLEVYPSGTCRSGSAGQKVAILLQAMDMEDIA